MFLERVHVCFNTEKVLLHEGSGVSVLCLLSSGIDLMQQKVKMSKGTIGIMNAFVKSYSLAFRA